MTSALPLTAAINSTPTAASGSVSFTVADPSQFASIPLPFNALHSVQGDVSAPLTRATRTQLIQVTAVAGNLVTATLGISGAAQAISFGDIIDASPFISQGLRNIISPAGGVHINRQGITVNPGLLSIIEGTAAAPITNYQTASVMITRRSAMTVVNDSNAALWVNHFNNGATQPVAGQFYAENLGSGAGGYDACGLYVGASTLTGRAYGGYFVAGVASHASGTPGAIPLNVVISNYSGADASLATLGVGSNPFIAALYVQANAGTGNRNGFGVLLGSGINLDAGVYLQAGSVVTVGWRDDSSAVTGIIINGVRTTGVQVNSTATNAFDASGATISGYHYKMSSVSGLGLLGATGPAFFVDTNDYLLYNQSTNAYQFVVNNAATLQFSTGAIAFAGLPAASPGAGSKQFWYDAADGNRVKYAV